MKIAHPEMVRASLSKNKSSNLDEERKMFAVFSGIAKNNQKTSVTINNVRYDGDDAIKKRLDEINRQLAL